MTQEQISRACKKMEQLLLAKNEKYGDSALSPINIFYKGDAENSILIRLDDKINRLMNRKEDEPSMNDVCDLTGYLLLLIASKEDEWDLTKLID